LNNSNKSPPKDEDINSSRYYNVMHLDLSS
jgi:hypothetical protein